MPRQKKEKPVQRILRELDEIREKFPRAKKTKKAKNSDPPAASEVLQRTDNIEPPLPESEPLQPEQQPPQEEEQEEEPEPEAEVFEVREIKKPRGRPKKLTSAKAVSNRPPEPPSPTMIDPGPRPEYPKSEPKQRESKFHDLDIKVDKLTALMDKMNNYAPKRAPPKKKRAKAEPSSPRASKRGKGANVPPMPGPRSVIRM